MHSNSRARVSVLNNLDQRNYPSPFISSVMPLAIMSAWLRSSMRLASSSDEPFSAALKASLVRRRHRGFLEHACADVDVLGAEEGVVTSVLC